MRDLERERKERTGYSPFHDGDPRHVVRPTVGGWESDGGIPPESLRFLRAQGAAHKKENPAFHAAPHGIEPMVGKGVEKTGDEGD
jgi:hypothetical protein